MGFASGPYDIEAWSNERHTPLFIQRVHDRSLELAAARIGWTAWRSGSFAPSNGTSSNQAKGGSRMSQAFEVPLLGLALDLVDRMLRGNLHKNHGGAYGAVYPWALT